VSSTFVDVSAESPSFPPCAYLIGAQKAGTTYLAGLLNQSPTVELATPKEPHYFTQHQEKELGWYRQCFGESSGKVFVDASTSYSAAPVHAGLGYAADSTNSPLAGVPERIHAVRPDARFIYIIRDPVERTWSSYWHDVRAGEQRLPFEEAIERHPYYTNMSDYLAQIQLYLRFFPIERFLFLRFEDMRNNPEAVVIRCLRFIGALPPTTIRTDQPTTHSSYQPGKLASVLIRSARTTTTMKRIQQRTWSALPDHMRSYLWKALTNELPEMKQSSRQALQERFLPMVQPLSEITKLDLSMWKWWS